jgi:transposase
LVAAFWRHPPPPAPAAAYCLGQPTVALCRELRTWWSALWTFARVEGVEPTNNGAERALRPAVLWCKGSFASDSEVGSWFAERLLTMVASCRQEGRPLTAFLVAAGAAALQGSRPPS